MSEVTLEKVDKVRERTGISYTEAKHALEVSGGDVLEALIYLETVKVEEKQESEETKYQTIEEFKNWLNGVIEQGNVRRIKVRKENKVIIDVPVNAGIAAGVIALLMPSLLAIGVIAAVATKLTVEITKEDGSVEVINKVVKETALDLKDKAKEAAEGLKEKISELKNEVSHKTSTSYKSPENEETIYSYTVKFDEED
jgi:hypothetical protein